MTKSSITNLRTLERFKPSSEELVLLLENATETRTEHDNHKTTMKISISDSVEYTIEACYDSIYGSSANRVNYWKIYAEWKEKMRMISKYSLPGLSDKIGTLGNPNEEAAKIQSINDLIETIKDYEAQASYYLHIQDFLVILESVNGLKLVERYYNHEEKFTDEAIMTAMQMASTDILLQAIEETTAKNIIEPEFKPQTQIERLMEKSVRFKDYYEKSVATITMSEETLDFVGPSLSIGHIGKQQINNKQKIAEEELASIIDKYDGPLMSVQQIKLKEIENAVCINVYAEIPYHKISIDEHGNKEETTEEITTAVFRYTYVPHIHKEQTIKLNFRNIKPHHRREFTIGKPTSNGIRQETVEEFKIAAISHWNLYAPFLLKFYNEYFGTQLSGNDLYF